MAFHSVRDDSIPAATETQPPDTDVDSDFHIFNAQNSDKAYSYNNIYLARHEDTHKAVEEQKLPRFRCDCGGFWAESTANIDRHQTTTTHRTRHRNRNHKTSELAQSRQIRMAKLRVASSR